MPVIDHAAQVFEKGMSTPIPPGREVHLIRPVEIIRTARERLDAADVARATRIEPRIKAPGLAHERLDDLLTR